MSKVEIEDVLSSIRRLVSEDSRPSIVRGGPPLDGRSMTAGPERLLLTPALRVVAEAPERDAETSDAVFDDLDLSGLGLSARVEDSPQTVGDDLQDIDPTAKFGWARDLADATLVSVDPGSFSAAAPIGALVAGLGAAVDAQPEEWESETGDEPPPLPEGAAAVDDADWDQPDLDLAEVSPHQDFIDTDELGDDTAQQEALRQDAEEAALQRALADAEDLALDEEEPPEVDRPMTFAAYPRVRLVNPILPGRAPTEPWHVAPAAEVINPAAAQDEPFGWAGRDDGDALDTLSNGTPTLEPDSAWADAAEAEAVQELSDQIHDTVADEVSGAFVGQMAAAAMLPLSDEALREMVRDLIVEELQGPLGQRITRNIRKLVRAEIARAMATDEMY